jgi:adenosylcobinamide kinase / adenosylcobinamide-phosphate guanylyltransferase
LSDVTFVLGGARSGKSRFAEGLAPAEGERTYIATAEAFDDELKARIAQHKVERGEAWTTIEAPLDLVTALQTATGSFVLIDCVTIWLGNLMFREKDVRSEVAALCDALAATRARVVLVSNEVGFGIVPENALARRFRDEQGFANQRLAACADKVFLVAAGLPLRLK